MGRVGHWNKESIKIFFKKKSPEYGKSCRKILHFLAKNCWDLAESPRIKAWPHRIYSNLSLISLNLLKSKLDIAGFPWIYARSYQIRSRSRKISSNLSLILLELAGFVYNIGQVEWLEFWRRKPPLDLPASGLGHGNP